MDRTIDFVEGKTGRCLAAMALPLLAAMVLNMAYNLVDSLWIGNLLGEQAMAALTSATPIILVFSAFAMGIGNGISILVSQAVGAKDTDRQRSIVATTLVVSMAVTIVLTAAVEAALPFILAALNTPQETFDAASGYLSIYVMGFPIVYLYCYFAAVLRSFGDAMFQAIAMSVCTLLNAVLDPLFIMQLGVEGAAWATLLSQSACLVFILAYLKRKQVISVRLHDFKASEILPFVKAALPSIVQQAIPSVSTMVLTAAVSSFGISAIAAYGVSGKLEIILFYPAMVLNMALTSIVGQCMGAGRLDRAKDYLRFSLVAGGIILLILSAAVVGFSAQLSGLFVKSGDVAVIVFGYFAIVSGGYVLNTVTNCFLGFLNGMGKPGIGMGVMALYYLAVRIPLAYLFAFGAGVGLAGIWSAVLISHVIAAAVAGITVAHALRAAKSTPALLKEAVEIHG